jgi:hypothetical protein
MNKHILPPKGTILGQLRFFEIYDEFDGPKCFTVINEMNQLYLVYWGGLFKEKAYTSWLYAPISEKRLDSVRRGHIKFRDVFLTPETGMIYEAKQEVGHRKFLVFAYQNKGEFLKLNIPPESFKIDPDEIEAIAPEASWNFELKISKASSSPEISIVTKVLDTLCDVIQALMKDDSREVPKFHPLTAKYGSFEVKLGTNSHEKASLAVEQLNAILSDKERLDFNLKNLGLDPYRLKDFLDVTSQNKLNLRLSPKTAELLKEPIDINYKGLIETVKQLEQSTAAFIDSNKVPQANNIDRVIEIVERRLNGEKLLPENIDGLSSKRQVRYYIDAAYCLGLLTKNSTVTSPGRKLCTIGIKTGQYEYLADRFESSDFGWTWMKWSKVNNIKDLNPDSAELFVQECVQGLTTSTAKRRSTTLSKWVKVLKDHRRDYNDG